MARQPRLALSPLDLPAQGLQVVRTLPTPPKRWHTWEPKADDPSLPKRLPRGAYFLGQVEWSWSPMHSRINSFHVSQSACRRHWVLWVGYYDDNYSCWVRGASTLMAPRCGRLNALEAGQLLLREHWASEVDDGLDRFHWIAQEGDLDVSDLEAVADEVWG